MTNQIMITFQQILAHNPCVDGWAKLLLAKGIINQETYARWIATVRYSDVELPTEPFPLSDALETNGVVDTVWALRGTDNKELIAKTAILLAHQVEHLMTDQRSKDALRVAWDYLEGKATKEELEKARSDAAAADTAAAYSAAYFAAYAARTTARTAARAAAADTAADAYATADAAARAAAAYAVADANEIKEKQKQLLKEILDSGAVKCPWENNDDCKQQKNWI